MREETRMATSEAARKLSEDKVPYLFLYGDGKSVDIIANIDRNGQEIGNLLASIAIYDNAFAKMLKEVAKQL